MQDITKVFEPYNVPKETLQDLVRYLGDSPQLVDFVMKFHHCEEEPASSRAFTSAITIAVAYFLGGLLPLIPYFCIGDEDVYLGLYISIGVMVLALFGFGYAKEGVVIGFKGRKNIRLCCFSGVQMVVVGSVAAGSAMGLVRLFNRDEGSARVGCLDKD
jgi:VIT1/CCC1 family predicted Fe2+/Mn2+ transporter